ncbi:MAG: hypothetical protein GTN76_12775, partial [Candidatus Aenigmarchaeota archaeon]|nr:hypothetical protein [Candidatus Aenigmarchaeota archaeon]
GCKVTTPIVTPEESLQKETAPTDEKLEVKADTAYRIGPGDVLHISVWGNEELTSDRGQGIMVRPDGKISIPLLQDVTAEGLTTEELRSVIETRLKEFVVEPIVTVTVLKVNFPKYFIMGEIANPGTYPLRQRTTILQAISLAGGFTDFASTSNIILIRERNPY